MVIIMANILFKVKKFFGGGVEQLAVVFADKAANKRELTSVKINLIICEVKGQKERLSGGRA